MRNQQGQSEAATPPGKGGERMDATTLTIILIIVLLIIRAIKK
jgi:hypothetical protein